MGTAPEQRYIDFSPEEKQMLRDIIWGLMDGLMTEMPQVTVAQALSLISCILSVLGKNPEQAFHEMEDGGVALNMETVTSGEVAELYQKIALVMDNHLFGTAPVMYRPDSSELH